MAVFTFTDLNNEQINGTSEADIYHFNRGNGKDSLLDHGTDDLSIIDRVVLGAGISRDDVWVGYEAGNGALVITLLENGVPTGDELSILYGSKVGVNFVEEIMFADSGEILNVSDLPLEFHGTDGDDVYAGAHLGFNEYHAGKGDDHLFGSYGVDNYYYNKGDGSDNISDHGGEDSIYIGSGICLSSIKVTARDNDLIIKFLDYGIDVGNQITVKGGLNYDNNKIENIVLPNGISIKIEDIIPDVFEYFGNDSGEHIVGADDHKNAFFMGDGDDRMTGSTLEDVFHGEGGRDRALGYQGADTYHFSRGGSRDQIHEDGRGDAEGVIDQLVFGEGIVQGDLQVSTNGDYLVITVLDDGVDVGDSVQIYQALWYDYRRIENIRFYDGEEITLSELLENTIGDPLPPSSGSTGAIFIDADVHNYGTSGNDSLTGTANKVNAFYGGEGVDQLYGTNLEDYYIFNRGDGKDYINEFGIQGETYEDRIIFGAGISQDDLIYTTNYPGGNVVIKLKENGIVSGDEITINHGLSDLNKIEKFQFSNGDVVYLDTLPFEYYGTDGNDTMGGAIGRFNKYYSGKGDDYINGSDNTDHYYYSSGDGRLIIQDTGGEDSIFFSDDFCLNSLKILGTNNNLELYVLSNGEETGDHITINLGLNYEKNKIENIVLHNGIKLKLDDLIPDIFEYHGDDSGEQIVGGDDHRNTFFMGSGNDRMTGSTLEDEFHGGAGRDRALGYQGADTYYFNRGDSRDQIHEDGRGDAPSTTDRIVFGDGISLSDLSVSLYGGYVAIDVLDAGVNTGDSVHIHQGYWYDFRRVEEIEFSDGSSVTFSGLLEMTIGDPLL